MIVTTKCATRLKNLETTRLPRNIFGRLTAYILISRQIFFKNSQRSISKQRNAETAILGYSFMLRLRQIDLVFHITVLLRDLAFKR